MTRRRSFDSVIAPRLFGHMTVRRQRGYAQIHIPMSIANVAQLVNADQSDAAIQIENSGNIIFSGAAGIQATNETGASIDITNSGDI